MNAIESRAIINSLTQKIIEQAEELEDVERLYHTIRDLKTKLDIQETRRSKADSALQKLQNDRNRDAKEIQSLRALVCESDAQRNSFCNQIGIVEERLAITQQLNKWLKNQNELCNTRYHDLWQQVHEYKSGGEQQVEPALIRPKPTPRTHRSVTCQTYRPACNLPISTQSTPAIPVDDHAEKEAAVIMHIKIVQPPMSSEICQTYSQTDTSLEIQQVPEAATLETQRLTQISQEQAIRINQLESDLELIQGKAGASNMEFGILERKYMRVVEEGLSSKEHVQELEVQLERILEKHEAMEHQLCTAKSRALESEAKLQEVIAALKIKEQEQKYRQEAFSKHLEMLSSAKAMFAAKYSKALDELHKKEQQQKISMTPGLGLGRMSSLPLPQDGCIVSDLVNDYNNLQSSWNNVPGGDLSLACEPSSVLSIESNDSESSCTDASSVNDTGGRRTTF